MDWLPEQFFHYLWKMQLFHFKQLSTHDGTPLQILHPGTLNHYSGADFSDARIYLGDTLWAGSVEIHRCSSDWWKHRHDGDKAYDNVVLHVVYKHDSPRPIVRSNGSLIPTLELKDYILPEIAQRYWLLLQKPEWIACEKQLRQVADINKKTWLDRLVVERLEQRVTQIESALEQNKNDWEQSFYESLARSLGAKVNAQPMEQLARALPQKLLVRHKDSLFQLEALLLGQAGLLDEAHKEELPRRWASEFKHLQQKYNLTPLPPAVWKYAKLRPANFPEVRLAQLARLAQQSVHLFSKMLEIKDYKEVYDLLNVALSGYWLDHFVLDEASPKQEQKRLGKASIESIAINTIVPFLFAYGRAKGEEHFVQKSLKILESLPCEDNAIIKQWKTLEMPAETAYQSQALLQLKSQYCDKQRCLDCALGHKIVSSK